MKKYKGIEKVEHAVVVFGRFDGFHKGHAKVVGETVSKAKAGGKTSVVVSCYSEKSDIENGVLSTEDEKAYFCEKAGVDVLISCNMDGYKGTLHDFVKNEMIERLGAETIVIGDKDDSLSLIKEIAGSCGVEIVDVAMESFDGKVISSQMVRDSLNKDSFDRIEELCGHPYTLIGVVVTGKQLGRTVGMPTANLEVPSEKCKPENGVYGTLSYVNGGVYRGMTNIGQRPSVDDFAYITVETFMMDFDEDIYGKQVVLEVYNYVRGVVKFNGLEEVRKQVDIDNRQIMSYFDRVNLP
jgi:riboflavin kinase/FMN adenylyltransferase